jgi:hypothetical protein
MISRGKADVHRLAHARVLLQADASEGGPDWTDTRIAAAVRVSVRTIAGAAALCRGRAGSGAAAQAEPARLRAQAGRRAGGQAGGCGLLGAARGQEALDAAALGPKDGGAGSGARTQPQDGTPEAQKRMRSSRTCGGCGASRPSARPSSYSTGKTCWRSTTVRMTRSGRWSAWMSAASS